MTYSPPTTEIGLNVAKQFKSQLLEEDIPVVDVYLFGSLAQNKENSQSDIDIAVIHKTFLGNRMDERRTIRRLKTERRYPMDILCFYPEDLHNKYYGLAQEVKKYGIAV